jgi:hypothetical protein
MASNNPYENDPWGQMTVGDIAKETIASSLNPASYAGAYLAWPGMWSIEKGVYVPHIGQYLESPHKLGRTIRHIGRAYKGRGVISGTSVAAGRTVKALFKGGHVGKRFFNSSKTIHKKAVAKAYGSAVFSQEVASWKNVSSAYTSNIPGFGKNYINKEAGLATQRAMNAYKSGSIPLKYKDSYKLAMKTASGKVRMATAAKVGIAGMKAVSVVGMAMLAWDIIKIAGEPMGAYAMNSLNAGMNRLQSAFSPELGGRLSPAYLSSGAATERQRAIQAMSKSYISGRSAFGQEASYMHQ